MFKFVVAVALFALASASDKVWEIRTPRVTPRPEALINAGHNSRIVGGMEANPHEFPHQVGLFFSGGWFCGGSIISENWVLTAAHCTDGAIYVDVVAGAHDISVSEPTQVTKRATNLITHESYGPATLRNDIGLIEYPEPITFDANIQPVRLATADPAVGVEVTPSGWGKDSDSATGITDVLRKVTVPILSNAECAIVYGDVTIYDGTICTDAAGGMGVCSGDSGGPMNFGGVTAGVTSFVASAGCESGRPHGFTRVTYFLDWIEANSGVTP